MSVSGRAGSSTRPSARQAGLGTCRNRTRPSGPAWSLPLNRKPAAAAASGSRHCSALAIEAFQRASALARSSSVAAATSGRFGPWVCPAVPGPSAPPLVPAAVAVAPPWTWDAGSPAAAGSWSWPPAPAAHTPVPPATRARTSAAPATPNRAGAERGRMPRASSTRMARAPARPTATRAIPIPASRCPGLENVNTPSSAARPGSRACNTASQASPTSSRTSPAAPTSTVRNSREANDQDSAPPGKRRAGGGSAGSWDVGRPGGCEAGGGPVVDAGGGGMIGWVVSSMALGSRPDRRLAGSVVPHPGQALVKPPFRPGKPWLPPVRWCRSGGEEVDLGRELGRQGHDHGQVEHAGGGLDGVPLDQHPDEGGHQPAQQHQPDGQVHGQVGEGQQGRERLVDGAAPGPAEGGRDQ